MNFFSLSYSDPWFLDTPNSLGMSIYNRDTQYPERYGFDATSRGATLAYGYRLGRFDSNIGARLTLGFFSGEIFVNPANLPLWQTGRYPVGQRSRESATAFRRRISACGSGAVRRLRGSRRE